ncbi:hypothetical protein NY78_4061 [Desulfovibrio sp. TomC]|nr:hypothetical protein NY78_4061 [Desulfovibrio sp. TomC]
MRRVPQYLDQYDGGASLTRMPARAWGNGGDKCLGKKRGNEKKGLPRVWSGGKDSLSRLGKTDATVSGEKKD